MSEFVAEPLHILDKDQTLALLNDPGSFLERGMEKWRTKSTWICDLLNEREKADGYQYNAQFQHWFEKEYNVGPFNENNSALSLLIYMAQRYREHDKLVAARYQPGSEELLRTAFEGNCIIEMYHQSLFNLVVNGAPASEPNVNRLKVREIGGKLYAMQPRKRKYAVNIIGKPVRLAYNGGK